MKGVQGGGGKGVQGGGACGVVAGIAKREDGLS